MNWRLSKKEGTSRAATLTGFAWREAVSRAVRTNLLFQENASRLRSRTRHRAYRLEYIHNRVIDLGGTQRE